MSRRTRDLKWLAYKLLQREYRSGGIERVQFFGGCVAADLVTAAGSTLDPDEAIAIVHSQIEIIEIEHDFARRKRA